MSAGKIDRLVRVLEFALSRNGAGSQLSEIADYVSGPLSSTHDLLRQMVDAGLLQVDARKSYRVGPTFMRLAMAGLDRLDIKDVAAPHLTELARSVDHDVYLAVRSGSTVTYVDRVPGSRRMGLDIKLGEPVPLHSSAVGKLFAAFDSDLAHEALRGDLPLFTAHTIVTPDALERELQNIRDLQFSISREETVSGIIGFAAPVRSHRGRVLAAVHVSAFKDYVREPDYARIQSAAQACADAISEVLGRTATARGED